jgi:hypothetical protein
MLIRMDLSFHMWSLTKKRWKSHKKCSPQSLFLTTWLNKMTGRNIKKEKWIPCTYQFEIQLKMFKIVFFVFRPLVDYYGPRRDLKNHTRGALTGHYWPPPGLTLFFPARAHRFKSIQTVRSHRHAVWKLSNTLLLVYHTHTLSHGHTHTHTMWILLTCRLFFVLFRFFFIRMMIETRRETRETLRLWRRRRRLLDGKITLTRTNSSVV